MKRFQRKIEDFICGHCGSSVTGDGYTNHCPQCLWSRHVDINPGDRAALCGGLMEPICVEGSTPSYDIVHRCLSCSAERRNMAQNGDNLDALTALSGGTENVAA